MTWQAWTAGVFLSAFANACGPDNTLEGSISEELPLQFDDVRIIAQPDAVRIEYIRTIGDLVFKVCRVSVDRDILVSGFNFIADDEFLRHVSIDRAVNVNETFPRVDSGFLELQDVDLDLDSELSGEFGVLFTNGRTLGGQFRATPIAVDP